MIYEKIYQIFRKGEFPNQFSESLSERHLQKLYALETISDNKVRFKIDRHPHAFGFTSRGMKSSAYRTITTIYEFDMDKDEIVDVGSEAGELFIQYEWLADEEVLNVFDDSFYNEKWEEDFKKIDNEEKAEQYALSEFEEIYHGQDQYWIIRYDSEDLPEDFKSRLLEEVKKRFIPKLVEIWKNGY